MDRRTISLVNVVNVSNHEVGKVDGFCMEIAGNKGKMPAQNDERNGPIRGVVSWGDCEYTIDEFQSLIQTEPNEKMKEIMVIEAVFQSFVALERNIRFINNAACVAGRSMSQIDSPAYSMTGMDKNERVSMEVPR